MEFDDGEEIDVKRSRTGTVVGVTLGGCCLLVCAGLLTVGVFWTFYDVMFADDSTRVVGYEGESLTLGITVTADTANVHELADPASAVVATLARGDTVEWIGWDDTLGYYQVKTDDGTVGYLATADATFDP